MQRIKLAHLFPQEMNIYGDWGNVLTLQQRCVWRGIHFEYIPIETTHDLIHMKDTNFLFMGGGQDKEQLLIYNRMKNDMSLWQETFMQLVVKGLPGLLICGGYQLFGKSFVDAERHRISGLDILPIVTETLRSGVQGRCIGNILVEHTLKGIDLRSLVGFENHGGQTFFTNRNAVPLGRVLVGNGNALHGTHEGCIYNNIIGTYLHGPLLPKNPHLADYCIKQALAYDSQSRWDDIKIQELDDTYAYKAHHSMCKRLLA